MERDFYKILLVSQSGKGKTYSFRNMNRYTTGFINAEFKPLPFSGDFKYYARPKATAGIIKAIQDFSENPEIEVIVLDSLSAVFEMYAEEARTKYSGWDIWGYYNKKIGEFLKIIKFINKEVFITAHYEILNSEGEPEKRVKVKGKEWEGVIEKEFTMVLYGEDEYKADKPEYFFKLAAKGFSAKCPPEIFGEEILKIPNDTNEVYKQIIKFTDKKDKELKKGKI